MEPRLNRFVSDCHCAAAVPVAQDNVRSMDDAVQGLLCWSPLLKLSVLFCFGPDPARPNFRHVTRVQTLLLWKILYAYEVPRF